MKRNELRKLFRPALLLIAAFGFASTSNLAFAAGTADDLDATINVISKHGTTNDVTHDIKIPNNEQVGTGEHKVRHHDAKEQSQDAKEQSQDAKEQSQDAKEQSQNAKEQSQNAKEQVTEAQGNGEH